MAQVIPPYGGKLVELLIVEEEARREWTAKAESLPSLQLSPRSVCNLELLATGAFSPLDRFMGQADYHRVLSEMRLADGTLFPVPVTLPVPDDLPLRAGDQVALRSSRNEPLAVMTVEERFRRDFDEEARHVCGTPVVTANVSSLPEVAGDAALKVDPYDSIGLAEAIYSVLTDRDLREELRQRGLQRVGSFSWQRTAEQISQKLDEALRGPRLDQEAGINSEKVSG